jgi:hypothetical protein
VGYESEISCWVTCGCIGGGNPTASIMSMLT